MLTEWVTKGNTALRWGLREKETLIILRTGRVPLYLICLQWSLLFLFYFFIFILLLLKYSCLPFPLTAPLVLFYIFLPVC